MLISFYLINSKNILPLIKIKERKYNICCVLNPKKTGKNGKKFTKTYNIPIIDKKYKNITLLLDILCLIYVPKTYIYIYIVVLMA